MLILAVQYYNLEIINVKYIFSIANVSSANGSNPRAGNKN